MKNQNSKEQLMIEGLKQVWAGEKTEGELLRYLRKEILGLTQQQYSQLAGISRRTLSDIENGKIQANSAVLNQAFKPIGLKLGLVPRFENHWQQLLSTN
jgi:DNA-binding XRE family transcriptional regulator